MATTTYELLVDAAKGRIGLDQRFIRQILESGEEGVPQLLKFAAEDHDEYGVDIEPELLNLFRALKTPRAMDYYIAILEERPEELAEEVMAAIRELGEPSVEALTELYEDLGDDRGAEIAFLLASLGIYDERIAKVLRQRLEVDPWDAAICIQLCPDPALKADVEKALEASDAEDTKKELRLALERIAEQPDLDKPEPFDVMSQYPEVADPLFEVLDLPDLVEFLSHENPQYRREAAEQFQNEDLDDQLAQKLLPMAESDPDLLVRAACWQALGGSDNEKIRKQMVAKLKDEGSPIEERAGVLLGLAEDPEAEIVHEYTERFYENETVRPKAMRAMWKTFNKRYVNYFPKHLNDADKKVQREAIWGVGYLGIGSVAGKLQKMFDDEDLREHALFSYALCVPGEVSRGRVKAMLRKVEDAAYGLSDDEREVVESALDTRLMMHGLKPVFEQHVHGPDCDHDHDHEGHDHVAHDHAHLHEEKPAAQEKIARNAPCPCGSGKKYKKCCGAAGS